MPNELSENMFFIEKRPDGNWVGKTVRFGNPIEVVEIDPIHCMQKLLTHE